MLQIVLPWWCVIVLGAESMVLDPALYLAPTPPLIKAYHDDIPIPWLQRDADFAVIPIGEIKSATSSMTTPQAPPSTETSVSTTTLRSTTTSSKTKTTEQQEMMEKSETYWPGLRPTASTGPYLGIQGIHVPLTFSLTGTYGRYGAGNVGVIGSSYASVDTEDSGLFRLYGKSGLAGSSYGSYGGNGGTRIYGGGGGAAWSGWGNGKWGHYGKG